MTTTGDDGRWVVLLRGVNVGGVTIRSADLRACVEGLGFTGVRTVLASGNVVVDATDEALPDAKTRIEAGLGERFGYDAWVVLVPQGALAAVVDAFPWPARDGWHDYVTFVSEPAVLEELLAAADELGLDPATDPVGGGEGVVYWQVPQGGTLDAPFSKLSSKARYRATTTTRNVRTLRRLL
ncbi:DUF1697 domain-containing protein [Luteimicrobium sp. DT211]|uniref:DUF1697 domain-containing protein n=1 Tax=Luteimicrobium sp. DT211 TaxID=3393412 RepID=UPI003CE7C2C0